MGWKPHRGFESHALRSQGLTIAGLRADDCASGSAAVGDNCGVAPSLADRLAATRSSQNAAELVNLGCELSDAGEHVDAAWCFQTALRLGDTVASFNLGNELVALG